MAIVIAATARRCREPSAMPRSDRRERQQQRLRDEELQRRQHLARRDDAERGQQKQRAGQRIERGDDRIGRAAYPHGFRSPTDRVIIATTEMTNAAPRNSVMRKSRSLASDDSMTTSTSKKPKILNSTSGMASSTAPTRHALRQPPRA